MSGMPEPARLLVVRHGQTAWNAAQRIQGHQDLPLDALGRWQARQLARALQGQPLAAVYSSDLQRALQTAQALAQARSLPVITEPGLRERAFGAFEGLDFAQIEQRWPEQAQRWRRRDPDFGPGGGETLRDFYARCVDCVLRLASAHPGQEIAVVAHGGVLDCLYRAATGVNLLAPRSWQLGNATLNRLLWTPQGLSLVGWNDNTHLEVEAGEEPPPELGP